MCSVSQFSVVLSLRLTFFCRLNTNLRVFWFFLTVTKSCLMTVRIFSFTSALKANLLHLQWLCSGNILVRGGAGQRQADLWGAVFCCMVVNYGLACVTLPAATFTFHPQLTLQNIDYTHAPLLGLFQPCQVADCCASLNQSLLSPEYVFIVDYSCVFWPVSGCVAQFLCNCRCQKTQNNKLAPPISHTLLLFHLF